MIGKEFQKIKSMKEKIYPGTKLISILVRTNSILSFEVLIEEIDPVLRHDRPFHQNDRNVSSSHSKSSLHDSH